MGIRGVFPHSFSVPWKSSVIKLEHSLLMLNGIYNTKGRSCNSPLNYFLIDFSVVGVCALSFLLLSRKFCSIESLTYNRKGEYYVQLVAGSCIFCARKNERDH